MWTENLNPAFAKNNENTLVVFRGLAQFPVLTGGALKISGEPVRAGLIVWEKRRG